MKIEKITFNSGEVQDDICFSILIPTWNNHEHLKLLVESIRKNSRYKHQIVVHINEGIDGTLEWVKKHIPDFSYSEANVGVCYAFNASASIARSEFLLLIDDDNYVLPDWDFYLWEEIQKLENPYFAISGTKIEPRKTLNNCVIAPFDFGSNPSNFREKELLETYKNLSFTDWSGSSWYPLVVHKKIWNLVGGLSTEFTPGMYSDPDFMMKLWQAGVRYFKGVGKSKTYHFISKSVNRVKKNNGRKQFLLKWGVSNSTFRKFYIHLGEPFLGHLETPYANPAFSRRLLRDRLKRLITF